MPSAGDAAGRTSVRHHLFLLVAANLLVVLVVGVAGIAVAVRSHRSVHYLSEKVAPAAHASASSMQQLTDAETYVWSYAITGDTGELARYRTAVAGFRATMAALERAKGLDAELSYLVDDFALAADDWFKAYAEPRIAGPVGVTTFDEGRFDRSRRLFADIRTTNAAVGRRLAQMSVEAELSAENLSHRVVLGLAGLLLLGALSSALVGGRVNRRVTEPLRALEETAHRLGRSEYDARASSTGPREVAQVAAAVNKMADENDRARAVEARVVEQLRALDAVKSDFVSNVSHELRTPLTSILGYVELLEEELRDHPVDSELEMIGATKRNVLRLGELIDDLLALTQSETQAGALVPVDLAVLAREIVTDLRVASSQQGVEIRFGMPGTPVPVRADSSQLARVVTNLVSNAVKFSEPGSEVVITVVADAGDAVLTVQDHGIGIPAEEMDQLGSRFYRASNAVGKGITGTGLGLRIVQAIVENHHGSVELRSTEGVGTAVVVRIPLELVALDERLPFEASSGAVG